MTHIRYLHYYVLDFLRLETLIAYKITGSECREFSDKGRDNGCTFKFMEQFH